MLAGKSAEFIREWSELFGILTSTDLPSFVALDSDALTPAALQLLQSMWKRKLLVETVVHYRTLNPTSLRYAAVLPTIEVHLTFDAADFKEMGKRWSESWLYAATNMMLARTSTASSTARAILATLTARVRSERSDIESFCKAARISRTKLYSTLADAGLPPFQEIQLFLRLLLASRVLQHGGSLDRAASAAHFADARGLRRALMREFGATVRDVRKSGGCAPLVNQWLNAHLGKHDSGSECAHAESTSDGRRIVALTN